MLYNPTSTILNSASKQSFDTDNEVNSPQHRERLLPNPAVTLLNSASQQCMVENDKVSGNRFLGGEAYNHNHHSAAGEGIDSYSEVDEDEILDCDRIFHGQDGVEREYDEHVAYMRENFPLNDRFLDMSKITQDFMTSWSRQKQALDAEVERRGGGTLQNLQPHDHLNAKKALQHLQELLNRELTQEGSEESKNAW